MTPTNGTDTPLPQPSWTTKYFASLAERVVRAFVVAFAGIYLADLLAGGASAVADMSVLQKAAAAGLAAAVNLVVGVIGKVVGDTGTPAILPARYDPATRTWSTASLERSQGRRGDKFVR